MFGKTAVLAVQVLDAWNGLPVMKGKVKLTLENERERLPGMEKDGGLFVFIHPDPKWREEKGIFLRAESAVYQKADRTVDFNCDHFLEYLWVIPGPKYPFFCPVHNLLEAEGEDKFDRMLLAVDWKDAVIRLAEDYRGGKRLRLFASGITVSEGQDLSAAEEKAGTSGAIHIGEKLRILERDPFGLYELENELKKSYCAGQIRFLPTYELERQRDGGFYFPVPQKSAGRVNGVLVCDKETEMGEEG